MHTLDLGAPETNRLQVTISTGESGPKTVLDESIYTLDYLLSWSQTDVDALGKTVAVTDPAYWVPRFASQLSELARFNIPHDSAIKIAKEVHRIRTSQEGATDPT